MLEKGTHIAIVGGGESGRGAALLAAARGYRPWVSEGKQLSPSTRLSFERAGIAFEEGGHDLERLRGAEVLIKSPGIPGDLPWLQELRDRGMPIWSEIEFAARHTQATLIAVTGTNGKTTTTSLIHHMLTAADREAGLVGNVGKSFAAALCEGEKAYYAVEVSSFQLDDIDRFKPHLALVLNISPDHLERYQNRFDRYRAAKFRITENQSEEDYLIYNADDPNLHPDLGKVSKAQCLLFGEEAHPAKAAWTEGKKKIVLTTQNREQMTIDDLALQGKHNRYNSMAAGLAGRLLGIRKETIRESLAGFESIEHRLEPVLQIYGMNFINDSKATNVNSTWYALESMQEPTIWIAGGVDKGNDYSQLNDLVREKVKALICIGKNTEKLEQTFGGIVPELYVAGSITEAVGMAYRLGNKGDNVLLSPACASFDWFENYEDRGRQFKAAVRNL